MKLQSYRLHDLPTQLPAETIARLAQVEAATIGHYWHDRFADNGIRPVIEGVRIAGTAVTVTIPGPDSTLLYHAMDRVRPGDVLVVERAGDTRHACWGGFMAAVAQLRGLAGVIIDGAITDPEAIRAAGVPTWGRAVSPITTKLLNLGGGFNVPIACGGVAVRPGDAVLADECGIVVIAPDAVAGITDLALADQAEEGDWIAELKAGKRLQDLVDIAGLLAQRADADAKHG